MRLGRVPPRRERGRTTFLSNARQKTYESATYSVVPVPQQEFRQPPFVVIIFENGLAPITPVYRVIDRAWIFDPNLASHKAEDGFRSALVKSKVAKLGTDPEPTP